MRVFYKCGEDMCEAPFGCVLDSGTEYFVLLEEVTRIQTDLSSLELQKDCLGKEVEELREIERQLKKELYDVKFSLDNANKLLYSEERKFWMSCCESVCAASNCVNIEQPARWADKQLDEYKIRWKDKSTSRS